MSHEKIDCVKQKRGSRVLRGPLAFGSGEPVAMDFFLPQHSFYLAGITNFSNLTRLCSYQSPPFGFLPSRRRRVAWIRGATSAIPFWNISHGWRLGILGVILAYYKKKVKFVYKATHFCTRRAFLRLLVAVIVA